MNIFGQIIVGLILIASGVLLLKNNYAVANNLRISFAEQHMGSGGSYLLWKIIAVFAVVAGITVIFGFHRPIIEWFLSPLTNVINPRN
jgi:uncharacterized membrane protein YphA (DoxX/SURF4 family)